ncbi:hypothetical protein [Afipia carboxidovorans]|uniref:hypothetical protein n=1 Tax=Afipia carboxidovorans TaxID=40137 RepID=UPI00308A39CB|nr:hypothetical protein CRBSH125_09610 [Afipia carboxidovorans]
MAKRKQLWHPDDVKAKIKTSQLINRLTDHALSSTPIMDASQVQAARALIAKVLPDVKEIDHKSSDGSMTPSRVELVALTGNDNRSD